MSAHNSTETQTPRKYRFHTALLGLAAALTLALGVVAVSSAAPAQAACYGANCAGQDPQAQGCSSDATTVSGTEMWLESFSVAMRHSNRCSARWARIVIDQWLPWCCNAIRIAIERILRPSPPLSPRGYYTKRIAAGTTGSDWTAMVPKIFGDHFQVCFRYENMDGSSAGEYHCSAEVD
jgi:hypothetical protein